MNLGYIQIRCHADDWVVQTDLHLRQNLSLPASGRSLHSKAALRKGFLKILIVVCPTLIHFIILNWFWLKTRPLRMMPLYLYRFIKLYHINSAIKYESGRYCHQEAFFFVSIQLEFWLSGWTHALRNTEVEWGRCRLYTVVGPLLFVSSNNGWIIWSAEISYQKMINCASTLISMPPGSSNISHRSSPKLLQLVFLVARA